MHTLRGFLDSRRRDERGATFIFATAAMLLLLVPVCAYMLTVGATTESNVALQSLADAGAYDFAQYVTAPSGVPTSAITNALAENTSDISSATLTATQGCFTTTFTNPAAACSNGQYNAIQVVASAPHPKFLIGGSALSRTAVIEQTPPQAGVEVGTTLLSASSSSMADALPVMGTLFSALGASTTLSVVGYNGLAVGSVSLQQLVSASGGVLSPTNILSLGITPAGWTKIIDAADPSLPQSVSYGGSTASGCTPNNSSCLDLCEVVTISPFCPSGILPASDFVTTLNVLQTLTTVAELANGSAGISLTTALGLPNVSLASLSVQVITPPTVAFGPVGTSASNGQVNATLTLSLLSLLGLSLGNVSIAVTGATGTGTITAVNCSSGSLSSVKIAALTNIASTSVTVLGINTTATLTGASSTPLTYAGSVIPPTSTTLAAGTNPQTIGSTDPTISTGGLGVLGLLSGVVSFLSGSLLSPIFQSLGVSLANASVAALSGTCGSMQLVQ